MEKSELILLLGQLAADAGAAGADQIEKFWTSVAAKITSDMLAARRPEWAKTAKPAQVFTLTAQAYHDQLLAQMSLVPQDQRGKKFDIVRVAINASQQHGGISIEQAGTLRRVTSEVEAELIEGAKS